MFKSLKAHCNLEYEPLGQTWSESNLNIFSSKNSPNTDLYSLSEYAFKRPPKHINELQNVLKNVESGFKIHKI